MIEAGGNIVAVGEGIVVMPTDMPKALDLRVLGTDVAATHGGIVAATARIRGL